MLEKSLDLGIFVTFRYGMRKTSLMPIKEKNILTSFPFSHDMIFLRIP